MTEGPKRLNPPPYLTREPVNLALLTGLAVVVFSAVAGLSSIYYRQQTSLAERWAARGRADLKAQNYRAAVSGFRTALLYSRDSDSYQLNLAEALLGMKRTDEADTYLIGLWSREPENGVVNLELARIAAQRGDTTQALRFYHNAIYATWPGDQVTEMRNARLELVNYLLKIKAQTQAQAELIALAANVGDNSEEQEQLGQLLLEAHGYTHALIAFRQSLRSDRHNQAAMQGAGIAAFELGQYPEARRFLHRAVAASPGNKESVAWLNKVRSVLLMDPYRPQISNEERNLIVVSAFATAGDRLKSCPALSGALRPATAPATATATASLAQQWAKLKPRITEGGLRRNPDLVNTAMDLAFEIERQASNGCGPPTEADQALLLIANLREEN